MSTPVAYPALGGREVWIIDSVTLDLLERRDAALSDALYGPPETISLELARRAAARGTYGKGE